MLKSNRRQNFRWWYSKRRLRRGTDGNDDLVSVGTDAWRGGSHHRMASGSYMFSIRADGSCIEGSSNSILGPPQGSYTPEP